MEKRNNSLVAVLFVIIIVLITFIVLYMTGIISFNKPNTKNNENKTNVENNNNESKVEEKEEKSELDPTNNEVSSLMKVIDSQNNNIYEEFGYFYKNDYYDFNSISEEVKVVLAIKKYMLNNYGSLSAPLEVVTISRNDVENKVREIFGSDKTVAYPNNSNTKCGFWYYDEEKNNYTIGSGGCGGTALPHYETKIVSATKYNNERIEIIEKNVYVEFENMSKIIYTDSNKNNQVAILNLEQEFNIDNYLDKLDSYKYTFKNENGNYYLYSVEKVK